MAGYDGNELKKVSETSYKLEAIGSQINESNSSKTKTGELDLESAIYLEAARYLLSFSICGQGFICPGGRNCTSDHK